MNVWMLRGSDKTEARNSESHNKESEVKESQKKRPIRKRSGCIIAVCFQWRMSRGWWLPLTNVSRMVVPSDEWMELRSLLF